MIEPGSPAPDFSLPDQDGNRVSLSDLSGRDGRARLLPGRLQPRLHRPAERVPGGAAAARGAGARLLGISVDGAFCHKAFRQQHDISIPLLADFHPKGEVAKAYGVWSEEHGVAGRALVMVGPDGVVQWSYLSPPLEIPGANLIFDALEQRTPA